MLRMIIAIYKTSFLVSCAIALVCILVLGFLAIMNGMTPADRWFSLSFMIGGSLLVVVLAGSLALQIENNELLRTIAANTLKAGQSQKRSHPIKEGTPSRTSAPSLRRDIMAD